MKKILLFVLIAHLFCLHVFSQSQTIQYGNNKAAGKYYNIRGFKMYCEIYGTGKPLLMIHGNNGSINAFENNIPYFAKRYKVIVADSRSQGKSVDPQDSLSFEMMADDEAALLNALHIDSAYIVGWSDGGIIALLLAMRHPEKVIKLLATGANLWPDSTDIDIFPSDYKNEKKQFDTTNTKNLVTPKLKNDWKMFLLDWLQPNISLSSLQSIKCPSLIICGDHDVIKIEHTVLIYQNIPHAYLWVVPNSSHSTFRDHRDEFDEQINEFFKGEADFTPK